MGEKLLSDAYRCYKSNKKNSHKKTNQWKLKAVASCAIQTSVKLVFLIFLPASGVDGCYKERRRRESSKLLRQMYAWQSEGSYYAAAALQSDDEPSQ